MKVPTRRGNCIHTNEATGMLASKMLGMMDHDSASNIMIRAEENAIIIATMERKRVKRAIIIFVGKFLRKSSSA